MKIVRTDSEIACPIIDDELRAMGADLVLMPEDITEDQLAQEVVDADLLLMCYTPITRRVIERAPRLKGIIKYGVGIDAIDMEAAIEHGIPVVNIPEYAEETVAEGAFCLMIALAKRLVPMHNEMQTNGWFWPEADWRGLDIAGKTVGVLGAGKIGRSFARMAGAGFRARVIGYDPHVSTNDMAAAGIEKFTELHEFLNQCDFVSLHCVLHPETRGIIGKAEFEAMKPTAFLINTSRGGLVDQEALMDALHNNEIAGAGLDVFVDEPLTQDGHQLSALYDMENVLILPHVTFLTHESMERLERETLERCREILEGRQTLVKSGDPRLRAQSRGVRFQD
ncbi:MAG: C-terminal binding protein [Pseudomonadota bacterium]